MKDTDMLPAGPRVNDSDDSPLNRYILRKFPSLCETNLFGRFPVSGHAHDVETESQIYPLLALYRESHGSNHRGA